MKESAGRLVTPVLSANATKLSPTCCLASVENKKIHLSSLGLVSRYLGLVPPKFVFFIFGLGANRLVISKGLSETFGVR